MPENARLVIADEWAILLFVDEQVSSRVVRRWSRLSHEGLALAVAALDRQIGAESGGQRLRLRLGSRGEVPWSSYPPAPP